MIVTTAPPPRRHTWPLLTLGAVTVVIAAAAVLIAPSDATIPRSPPPNAQLIDIANAPMSRPISPGFVGLSIEYPSALAYFGTDLAAPNPIFIRLVQALNPSRSPVIRFGGDTTDWTWWPTPGVNRPAGVRYALTRRWLAVTRATALALHAHLILGINLEDNSAIVARAEARAFAKASGGGSSQDLSSATSPGSTGDSTGTPRTPGSECSAVRPAMTSVRTSSTTPRSALRSRTQIPLVGPASGSPSWTAELSRCLAANPRVRIVTFHRYLLHRCFTRRGTPTYPTIPNLLARRSTTAPALSLRAAVRVAHADRLALRADELNSVSCGGVQRVSDRFASALWVLDTLFNMAAAGVDGVNIHTFSKARYEPFSFARSRRVWRAHVAPMYYGMLMFARAAPTGSHLLSVRVASSQALRIWAVRARDGTVRVTAINDSSSRTLVLAVGPPHASGAASLERLTAPSLESRTGVTIAGQTFGAVTTTGELTRSYRTTTLQPIQYRYVVELPPASAALLSVKAS